MINSIFNIFSKFCNKSVRDPSHSKAKIKLKKTEERSIDTEVNLQKITQSKMNEQLLSRREAAKFLGVKENTLAIWKLTNRQIIPTYKVGKFIKYKASDLQKFIDDKLIQDNI